MKHSGQLRRSLGAVPLAFTVYCAVSGGPFGLEPVIGQAGIRMGLFLILIAPFVWALPAALMTAELAAAMPEEGGYVVWVRRGLGELPSFLCGWWTWLYSIVDAAVYPVLFTTYLSALLKSGFHLDLLDKSPALAWLVAVGVIAFVTALNIRGAKWVGVTSTVFTLLLVFPFLLMVIIGIGRQLQPGAPPLPIPLPDTLNGTGLAGGLAVVMWNYLGWDNLSTVAEEVEKPEQAYPKALMFGVPLVTLAYFLPAWLGSAYRPDAKQWSEGAWPEIVSAVSGGTVGSMVNVGGLISPVAQFLAAFLAASRIPFVLAEGRYLPSAIVKLHPKFGTPHRAILVCSVVFLCLAFSTFQALVALNVVLYSCALVFELITLVMLRLREPNMARPFRVPGGLVGVCLVAVLPIGLTFLLVATAINEEGWVKQIPTGLALLSGPIVYWFAKRRQDLTSTH